MATNDDLNLGKGGEQPAESSGGKGKLIIIVAAVLLLVGGGGAAYVFLGGSDEATADTAEAAKPAKAREPLYADMKKLLVNLDHGGRTHFVQAEMQLMSYSPEVIDQAYRDMPAIRDRLLMLFNQQDFANLKSVEGKEALRAEALKVVNSTLGLTPPDVVEELYFENFVLQ